MDVVYIETTIISFLVARPSRDLVLAAQQSITREWWDSQRQSFRCVVSDEVVREARRGDAEMAQRRLSILAQMETIETTEAMRQTADQLLKTGALPPFAGPDALHLAAAMLTEADYLLTWNCRHLANAHILRRLEREALRIGHMLPTVCTPFEMRGG